MDVQGFELYLARGGRGPSAVKRCIRLVLAFEEYLSTSKSIPGLDQARPDDLIDFVRALDEDSKKTSKGYLWALRYYYDFRNNRELSDLARVLREERIERKPFSIKNFRGIDSGTVDRLAKFGIRNIDQMMEAGASPGKREELAAQTGIPLSKVVELVKLSDLARIPGVKSIRARLYYDAGLDTVEKIANLEPGELRSQVVDFIEASDFEGVPTLPAEAVYTVEKARSLLKIVEY